MIFITPLTMTEPTFITVASKTINAKLVSSDKVPLLLYHQCAETRTLENRMRLFAVRARGHEVSTGSDSLNLTTLLATE